MGNEERLSYFRYPNYDNNPISTADEMTQTSNNKKSFGWQTDEGSLPEPEKSKTFQYFIDNPNTPDWMKNAAVRLQKQREEENNQPIALDYNNAKQIAANNTPSNVPRPDVNSTKPTPNTPEEKLRESFVKSLISYIGTTFKDGGESRKNIDCSGLVREAMKDALKAQGRKDDYKRLVEKQPDAHDLGIGNYGHTVPVTDWKSINDLKPGDLIVLRHNKSPHEKGEYGHVQIYLGDGKIIQASNEGVMIMNLNTQAGRDRFISGIGYKYGDNGEITPKTFKEMLQPSNYKNQDGPFGHVTVRRWQLLNNAPNNNNKITINEKETSQLLPKTY